MSKVKIKHGNEKMFGKPLTLPMIGKVTVGADGVIEVDETTADFLVEKAKNWSFVDKPTKKDEKAGKTDANDKKDTPEDDGLEALEIPELKELAKEIGMSKKDIDKYAKNKKVLIAQLRKAAKQE